MVRGSVGGAIGRGMFIRDGLLTQHGADGISTSVLTLRSWQLPTAAAYSVAAYNYV